MKLNQMIDLNEGTRLDLDAEIADVISDESFTSTIIVEAIPSPPVTVPPEINQTGLDDTLLAELKDLAGI